MAALALPLERNSQRSLPDTMDRLAEGIEFVHGLGVEEIHPVLDLWARWKAGDLERLGAAIGRAAQVWRRAVPGLSVSWFDEKLARMCGFDLSGTGRCGFGRGQVAVAPSGNLYPCERLIGEDHPDSAARLRGHVLRGNDFLQMPVPPERSTWGCRSCAMSSLCNTTCRCSNYVRTGDPTTPDLLLCVLNKACLRHTAEQMRSPRAQGGRSLQATGGTCHE